LKELILADMLLKRPVGNSGMTCLLGLSLTFIWALFPAAGSAAEKEYINSIGIKMIRIAAGNFIMGSDQPEAENWDEWPAHRVTISMPFYISETEITINQFRQFRPNYSGSMTEQPYMTGLSWQDAMDFCAWLSEKEGISYRLPTEAEWEYAARAGTSTPFWSGEQLPPGGKKNPWGLANIHSGPLEWCFDWYGPYPLSDLSDPSGPASGLTKVIRGGGLDRKEARFARSANRASYGPSFAVLPGTESQTHEDTQILSPQLKQSGLIGVWYGTTSFTAPKAVDHLNVLDINWHDFQQPGEDRETQWSARWEGTLIGPATGKILLRAAADYSVTLDIGGENLLSWDGGENSVSAEMAMIKDKTYPIRITYVHNRGEKSYLKVYWQWEGKAEQVIDQKYIVHSVAQLKSRQEEVPHTYLPGHHSIGFRIAGGKLSAANPYPEQVPFIRRCVLQSQALVDKGPDARKPWYRRRPVIPIPPSNVSFQQSRAAGLPDGLWPQIHTPGLGVCPNGDLLASFYTSKMGPRGEDQPEVLLIGTRLRFGAKQWDMPEILLVFADVNTTSPCLYTEKGILYLFCGHTFYNRHYPFQWISSADNGATWSEPHFPLITGEIGPYTSQPINTIFRGSDGTWYVPTDGYGSTSVLWASKDNGQTWFDTGGRTFGRHTTFQVLNDGRILGMGGKKSNIDGYMPKSISADGGRSWTIAKTPFSELGGNQRPCLIRLQSGRLFFCGDFQHKEGRHPGNIKQRGSYVALSDDEGETWHIKELKGTLPHFEDNLYPTIGYSVARQSPDGLIHIISSATVPLQHFVINEAWILDENAGWDLLAEEKVDSVASFKEHFPSGRLRAAWSMAHTASGEYLLNGKQTVFYENGNSQWEVNWKNGKKKGAEFYRDESGNKIWEWTHKEDGTSVWTQYWPNGQKRSESSWVGMRAQGPAKRWNTRGRLISDEFFWSGRRQ